MRVPALCSDAQPAWESPVSTPTALPMTSVRLKDLVLVKASDKGDPPQVIKGLGGCHESGVEGLVER